MKLTKIYQNSSSYSAANLTLEDMTKNMSCLTYSDNGPHFSMVDVLPRQADACLRKT